MPKRVTRAMLQDSITVENLEGPMKGRFHLDSYNTGHGFTYAISYTGAGSNHKYRITSMETAGDLYDMMVNAIDEIYRTARRLDKK